MNFLNTNIFKQALAGILIFSFSVDLFKSIDKIGSHRGALILEWHKL